MIYVLTLTVKHLRYLKKNGSVNIMGSKTIITLGATVGSVAGSYLPAVWGNSDGLSFISLISGSIGGIIGIWIGYKLTRYIED